MKNSILIFVFILGNISLLSAQPDKEKMEQRVEAHRIAFITEHLGLSPEEAQQFWPVFNSYKAEKKALRKKFRKDRPLDEMTDAEVEALLASNLEREAQMLNLNRKYLVELKKVLPIRKVAKLQEAERAFKRKILERTKHRRAGKQK